MHITMIGTGYVGLVSGTCFADLGHDVTCVDKSEDKIDTLNAGGIPIYEPGLEELVSRNVKAGRLTFTTDLSSAVAASDAVFIAVGTPSRRGDGHADLSYVHGAARDIAAALAGHTVIVTKSTVPVGTGRDIEKIISETAPEADFDIASNPEFLREGSAIGDFMFPDRVVVGVSSQRAGEVMKAVYKPLKDARVLLTDIESAELAKYASNAFLATKITFINQMADICEAVGADVTTVAEAMGLDKRIGSAFLNAGPGYGGSCFPKDTLALARTASDAGAPATIVDTVIEANAARKKAMAERIVKLGGGTLENKTVAVLGVAFKPNTDDMRDAPALDILPALTKAGATVKAYDPAAMREAGHMIEDIQWQDDAQAAVDNADILVVLTEWAEFTRLTPALIKTLMRGDLVVDLRNLFSPEQFEEHGLDYHGIGRWS